MPAYNKPKYTAAQSQEIKMRALEVLVNSTIAMTIDEIQKADLCLTNTTSQKIARELGDLAEFGLIEKIKNKAGRMTYMSIETAERYRSIVTPRKGSEDNETVD